MSDSHQCVGAVLPFEVFDRRQWPLGDFQDLRIGATTQQFVAHLQEGLVAVVVCADIVVLMPVLLVSGAAFRLVVADFGDPVAVERVSGGVHRELRADVFVEAIVEFGKESLGLPVGRLQCLDHGLEGHFRHTSRCEVVAVVAADG